MNLAIAALSIFLTHATYDSERITPVEGINVRVGGPVYVWGGYEKPSIRLVGQSVGNAQLVSSGVGFRHDAESWYGFVEFGRYWLDPKTDDRIRDEAVWQELTNHHGDPGWYPTRTQYELDDAWGGRIGVGREIGWVAIEARYRWMSARETIHGCKADICRVGVTESQHWMERRQANLGAFEAAIGVRF